MRAVPSWCHLQHHSTRGSLPQALHRALEFLRDGSIGQRGRVQTSSVIDTTRFTSARRRSGDRPCRIASLTGLVSSRLSPQRVHRPLG